MPTPITAARTITRTLTDFIAGNPVDRDALLAFDGWGSLAPALALEPDGAWVDIAEAIADLPGGEALLGKAADVVDTSFFTPEPVVRAVYGLLQATGFDGGRVLELGCGTGRFFEHAPALPLEFVGVESDPLSAAIARHLHPTVTILEGRLERMQVPGRFDAVVGNVPFSQARVWDPGYGESEPIHRYFMRRALDALRPGGIAVLVTSRHVVDGHRPEWGDLADFLGAVRLPVEAFRGAGAEVVADVVVLRRSMSPETASASWPRGRGYGEIVSPYWSAHPGHVAGTVEIESYRDIVRVTSPDWRADVDRVAATLAESVTGAYATAPAVAESDPVDLADPAGRPEGSFHVDGSAVVQIVDGMPRPVARAGKELRALIELREHAAALLDAEMDPHHAAEDREAIRTRTRETYERYVARFGALNRGTLSEGKPDPDSGLPTYTWRRPLMGGFRRDPGYYTVMALEDFDQDSGTAAPAAILLRHINVGPEPVDRVDTPAEALSVSLGESGRIDLDRIAGLLGLPDRDAARAALDSLAFIDPATGDLEPAAAYLSGDVRTKLAAARAAGLDANVAALEAVLPEQLGPAEIKVALGAPWVASGDVAAFAKDVLGFHWCNVTYEPVTGSWDVEGSGSSGKAAVQWGTKHMRSEQILQHALAGSMPVVYDEFWEPGRGKRRVRNVEATVAAEDRRQSMQERFATWVWEDAVRAERIQTAYNHRFRSHAPRIYDGSHLTFPGLSSEIDLWPHQQRAIERIASSERVLLAHAVGAGKTLEMIAGAMTLRRFGLARKPLIVVPNHLLEQVAREASQAYPTGRFLIAQKEDLVKDARRIFAARCATGDWDAVVMTHGAFTSLPVGADAEQRWLDSQLSELTDQARHSPVGEYGGGRGAKALARARRSLTSRLEALRSGVADQGQVRFEQLGVDYLMVDEAHCFKRLPIASRNDGFSLGASKRATDLHMKIELLAMAKPGQPVVSLFTGTPWSNTIAETFVWQRYLQPDRLGAAGVGSFDGWAATFVRFETRTEVSPDGASFRLASRPTSIQNVPELMGMLGEVADIITSEQLTLSRPEADVSTVLVEPTDRQRAFVAALAERADRVRGGGGGSDNMLLICSEGRAAALDPALVGHAGRSPKVEAAADEIAATYEQTRQTVYGTQPRPGALQVVFCDLGTPHPGDAQTYGRLRQALVRRGVPNETIRWVHEAKTARARDALFEQCLDGRVAVLMGSTEKLGTGTNVQDRLIRVHHLDAPWRPSDITQREGRAIRPGNLNTRVAITRYATEGTFDAYMWQTLERKARFIEQLLATGTDAREASDIGDMQLSFGEVKALASGNPLLLEHAEAAADVRRLRTLAAVHRQSVNASLQEADRLRADASSLEQQALSLEAAIGLHDGDPVDESAIHNGRAWGRGLRFELGKDALRMIVDYRTADEIDVPRTLRLRATARRTWAVQAANEWLDGLGAAALSARSRVPVLRADADRITAEVETMRFDRADELRQAEARLGHIEVALAEQADDAQAAA